MRVTEESVSFVSVESKGGCRTVVILGKILSFTYVSQELMKSVVAGLPVGASTLERKECVSMPDIAQRES